MNVKRERKEAVERTYQAVSGDVIKMKWCAMAIGLMGAEGFDKDKIRLIAPDYFETIRNLWDYSKSTVSDYAIVLKKKIGKEEDK